MKRSLKDPSKMDLTLLLGLFLYPIIPVLDAYFGYEILFLISILSLLFIIHNSISLKLVQLNKNKEDNPNELFGKLIFSNISSNYYDVKFSLNLDNDFG